MVKRADAIYHYTVNKDGEKLEVTVDAKNDDGAIYFDKRGEADLSFPMLGFVLLRYVTFELTDDDLEKMVHGTLNRFEAIWNGTTKAHGSPFKALKYNSVIIAEYNDFFGIKN